MAKSSKLTVTCQRAVGVRTVHCEIEVADAPDNVSHEARNQSNVNQMLHVHLRYSGERNRFGALHCHPGRPTLKRKVALDQIPRTVTDNGGPGIGKRL